jgi:hypothetical protein
MPQSAQACCSENSWLSPSTTSTRTMPPARRRAVSRESARRDSIPGLHHQAVDHHLQGVLAVFVQHDVLAQFAHFPVDADAHEAVGLQLPQFLAVFALAPAHDGRQQQQRVALLRQGHDAVDHLLHRPGGDLLAAGMAMDMADAGEQQAQVVVDFGDRADRRAGVLGGGFLLDGDGRRQALDAFHVRLVHLLQKLPGIGREALHVATLALGIQGVEGQGTLSGAGDAGDDHQLVARDLDVDTLQIVLAGTLDDDFVHDAFIDSFGDQTLLGLQGGRTHGSAPP